VVVTAFAILAMFKFCGKQAQKTVDRISIRYIVPLGLRYYLKYVLRWLIRAQSKKIAVF